MLVRSSTEPVRWGRLLAKVDEDFPGLTDAERNEKASYLFRMQMSSAGKSGAKITKARWAARK